MMQAIGRLAASAGGGGGGKVGRELLRLRPLPNAATAAAAADSSERSPSTLPPSSSFINSRRLFTGRDASMSAYDMPLSAAVTDTSASAFVLQQPLMRRYSTSTAALGTRGRSARRAYEKRARRRRQKKAGGSSGSGGGSRRGGNKPLLRGGRGRRGGGGGGGSRLDLLPLPSSDVGGSNDDAFGAFSSAKDEYEALYKYCGGMDDDYDDDDGERRLYYYQTPDEADEANGGGGIGDVPPTILSKMESDPTYFHGMEGLALHWTTPSTDPPSRDGRVQAVMRDIIQRQKLAATTCRNEKKKGQDVEGSGWNGKVIVRIPKANANSGSNEDAIEDQDDVGSSDNDEEEEEDQGAATNDDDTAVAHTVSSISENEQNVVGTKGGNFDESLVEIDPYSPTDANDGAESDSVSKAASTITPKSARSKTTLSKTSEKRFAELERFKEDHGHLNVPQTGETKSLHHWLNNKKRAHDDLLKGGEGSTTTVGTITQEEIAKLERMGIDWTVSTYSSSESRLADLARFKEKHGHLNVPRYGDEYSSLYKWLYSRKVQRDDFLAGKKTTMSQEEFDRLNELGLDWSVGGKSTGYNVFTKLRTEQMRQSNADLSPREVRDKVLTEWREMTDEEKLVWKAKAENIAGI